MKNIISQFMAHLVFAFLILLSGTVANATTIAGSSNKFVIIPTIGAIGDPDFGDVPVGSSVTFGAAQGLSINFYCQSENGTPAGTSCGTISNIDSYISGSSDFQIVSDGCAGVVYQMYVGSTTPTCSWQVSFTPSSIGPKSATGITDWYVSDLQQAVTFSIPLSGNGIAPPPPLPPKLPPVNSSNCSCAAASSSINIDALALLENIPLVGVPFSLNYASDRFRSSGAFSPKALGLGGWTPSLVHFYDSKNNIIYYGDGSLRNVQAVATASGYYVTDQAGSEIYYFNSSGAHTQTKDALTGIVKYNFSYNLNNQLIAISDRFSNITSFQYATGQVLVTSPYGQQTVILLDSNGFLNSVTNPNHETYLVTSDSTGLLLNFQKPMGQKSVVSYDQNGYVIKDQGASGDFISLVQSFDTNSGAQTVTTSTALNRASVYVTSATATSSNHQITSPEGGVTVSNYQDAGTNVSTDAYGNSYQSVQGQDPRFGWLSPFDQNTTYTVPNSSINISSAVSKTADLANQADPFSFTALTTKTTLQNDSTRIFTSTYQAAKKLLTSTSPLNRVIYETLNANGQPSAIQLGSLLPVNFSYDSKGRLNLVAQGDRKNSLTYDQHSNVATSTDPLDRKTSFQYDKANRVIRETLPDNNVIAMTWDANGNMTSITPPGKTAHNFSYNLFELLQNYLPPSINANISGATIYSYNLDKQVTKINRPEGTEVDFNYSPTTGLLNSINTSSGNYSISYQTNSNLVSAITSPDNEILNYQYAGNIPTQISATGPVASSVQYFYNNDGTLAKLSVGGGSPIALAYDKDGLITKSGDESFTRNNVGAISATNLGKISEALKFDNFGQMTEEKFQIPNKKLLYLADYQRDALGRINSISQEISHEDDRHEFSRGKGRFEKISYSYDKQGRLEKVFENNHQIRSYKFDPNGNRVEASYEGKKIKATYDAQDRLVKYGNTEFQYNASGDLTEKIEHKDGGKEFSHHKKDDDDARITKYNFDVFGNLKSVQLPNGKLIEYIIDGQNRRVGKKVNGKLVQGLAYQNQTQIAVELDSTGKIVKQFVYGEKSNVPDYMIYKGKEYRIISDQVGTPKIVVDASTGAVLEQLNMDEFGFEETLRGTHVLPFGFAGGIYDTDTGPVRMGARDYSPKIGRFVSKDPEGFSGGQSNLYAYVINDPINFVDPLGKDVTISLYPGASGFGHIGIGINSSTTYGFYPQSVGNLNDQIVGSAFTAVGLNVPGIEKPDVYHSPIDTITIKTSASQDAAMHAYLNNLMSTSGLNYNLFNTNCAIQAQNILNAGGINTSGTILPQTLFNELKGMFH